MKKTSFILLLSLLQTGAFAAPISNDKVAVNIRANVRDMTGTTSDTDVAYPDIYKRAASPEEAPDTDVAYPDIYKRIATPDEDSDTDVAYPDIYK